MSDLPAGTVTFLFTDIEGSTNLVRRLGDTQYSNLRTQHHAILREVFSTHSGREVDTAGDGFFVAFPTAGDGVAAALTIQRRVASHTWPAGEMPRLRIGLHTGEPLLTDHGYVGMDVHRAARIAAAGYGGQILLSQTTANLIHDDLPDGVSLLNLGEHRLKDLQRPERIFQLAHPDLPGEFPDLRSLSATPNNLPVQLTSFIGREREIADIRTTLTRCRLLTLTGPGGCGKTRLALQIAAELFDRFPEGIWFVELGPLTDPGLVPRAVAADLGLRQDAHDMTTALAEHLHGRRTMIILDSCEHVLATSARLAEALLRQVPQLHILATSRQLLGVAGEMNYVVPPLSLPHGNRMQSLDQLEQSDAAKLFVERALLSRPGFSPTDAMAPAIAQVVLRLDGIPLAIELAAARVNVLSVDQIARRLDDRFRLLRGATKALARQQTLRAAIDWSYDLLGDEEKLLFRRLSPFAGRFSLQAVEAICPDQQIPAGDLIEILSQLIDKSLVLADEYAGQMRYRLLESVREYSREKLAASGEQERLSDGHLAYFLALAEEAEPHVRGAEGQTWLEELDGIHDDLRAALARARNRSGEAEHLLRLASALWYFWFERGYWTEGRDWLENALARYSGPDTIAYGRAVCAAAVFAWRQGDNTRAASLAAAGGDLAGRLDDKGVKALALLIQGLVARRKDDYALGAQLHEESLALFRDVKDLWGVGESLRLLGINLWYRGDYPRAAALFQEGLAFFRGTGDQRGIADSLHWLGRTAAFAGDMDVARPHLEECIDLYRKLGRPSGLAQTLYIMGRIEAHPGNYNKAEALLDESLALLRSSRDELSIAGVLTFRGRVDIRRHDHIAALKHLQESLAIRIRLGQEWDKWGVAEGLEGLAELAVAQGRHEAAASLLAIAFAVRTQIGAPLPPIDQAHHQLTVAQIKTSLGEQRFQDAWKQGEGLSANEAPSLTRSAS